MADPAQLPTHARRAAPAGAVGLLRPSATPTARPRAIRCSAWASAPLEEPLFRAAVFKQLGEDELEDRGHGRHLRRQGQPRHPPGRGGDRGHPQGPRCTAKWPARSSSSPTAAWPSGYATVPEMRLAVGQPDLDIGNVETVLEALAPPDGACFYLDVVKQPLLVQHAAPT
ncbi:MAG: hypothetical protein V9H69_17640 [Anaerolineae bacterium]